MRVTAQVRPGVAPRTALAVEPGVAQHVLPQTLLEVALLIAEEALPETTVKVMPGAPTRTAP
jgi:hypothetical protein